MVNQRQRILVITLLIPLFSAVKAESQIYECDGRWTNSPCGGAVTKQFDEQPGRERSPVDAERSRRKLWLHELDMLSLEAKRKYGVVPVLTPIQDLCLNEKSTSDDCRSAISAKESELQKLMAEYARTDAQKNSDPAAREKASDGPNITVVNQPPRVIYLVPRRRHIETYATGGASIAIGASGTLAGSNVFVGVGAGTVSAVGTGSSGSQFSNHRAPMTQLDAHPALPSSNTQSVLPAHPLPPVKAQPVPLER